MQQERCKWEIESCKRLGYAAVSQLCDDYHKAWKHGNKGEIARIEFCLLAPHNVERLTFEEQNGEQILQLLKETCRERYGKFKAKTRKKAGKKNGKTSN